MKKISTSSIATPCDSAESDKTNYLFQKATGHIPYNMTNDYIFRIVLQKNEDSRKCLIRDLLHLKDGEVVSATVLNPIDPGDAASAKETRMDIRVELNNHARLNIEMQVTDYHDWPERSLTYLAREFNSLKHGEDYKDVPPVYQIAFLNYTLFPEDPEFYATYRMINVKTGKVYSDKYTLSVIELNHIDIATEDDHRYGIDKWAMLLKATTWEEVKMITEGNNALASTAESIFLSNEDYNIRKVALEREEARIRQEKKDELIKQQAAQINDQAAQINDQAAHINDQAAQINDQAAQINDQAAEIERLKEIIASAGLKA